MSCIFVLLIMVLYFIFAPSAALTASKNGLSLWFEQLLPTLLPFSILSYIILSSNLFASFHKKIKWEWYIIICGFLFGFPIGSKLTADCYREGWISKENASILCCFTNNLSPVFVTAVLREQLGFPASPLPYLLLYGLPFFFGILCLIVFGKNVSTQKNTASRFQLNMQIIDAGIINGFETLIKICGYVIMFSIFSEMLKSLPIGNTVLKLLIIGCTEVTNGIAALTDTGLIIQIRFLLAILFLSWNGISGLFQTASILSKTDLSIRKYLKIKLILVTLTTGTASLFVFLGWIPI